jgi:glutamate 5-kinase
MLELARQCALIKKQGVKVIIVSSGAVAAGKEQAPINCDLNNVNNKQMLAAIGQSHLIYTWQALFKIHNIHVGQMLLTRADIEDRERYINARDTLNTLLKYNVIPIINENDAVATDEIKVGDNDNLSALTAILAKASTLLILTDQAGLFTSDPRDNPEAKLITKVDKIDSRLMEVAGGAGSHLGTGGMATKLSAADIASQAGIEVIITSGYQENVINDVANGKPQGTLFKPIGSVTDSRKQWLMAGPPANGKLFIDDGAVEAMLHTGASLLAKGLLDIIGDFERGAIVKLCNTRDQQLARGICRYSSSDLLKIKGKHSDQIKHELGYDYGVVMHRDDLVLKGTH